MKLNYEIDYIGLELFLNNLQYSEIETTWDKPKDAKLIEATLMDDIDFFDLDKSTIPLQKVVFYGFPFLLDAIGNDLSICILSKRRHKLPTGRVIKSKFDRTIIKDCRKKFGTPLNGCWLIPSRFLLPI